MRPVKLTALALLLAVAASCSSTPSTRDNGAEQTKKEKTKTFDYPDTERQDVVEEIFGQTVSDPYRWLEDASSDKVQSWMEAQDDFARDYLDDLPGRDKLAERFEELFYVDALYAPSVRGGRYFYRRRHADKEKAVFYWKESAEGEEKVLLDPNTMSEDGSLSIGGVYVAWDGKTVAYKAQENNADEATLYVMDVDTGEVSDVDVIEGAKYAYPSWTPDSKGFYYTYLPTDASIPVDERPGHAEVRYHELGTKQAQDKLVREKTGDARSFLGVDLSRDGRWLLAYVWHGWDRADVYYQDLKADKPEWTPLVTGTEYSYEVHVWEDHFYIFTDEKAPNWRLMKVSAENPARENWTELIAQDDERVLDEVQIRGGHLVLSYLENAHSAMDIRKLDGTFVRKVELPTIGASFGMKGDPDRDEAYYSFMSFTTPRQIYKTSIKTGETELWEKVELPIDPEPYKVDQVWYESKDGTKVSMFIVHRKDIEFDGSTPLLLYGYGGFNVNMRPYFRSSIYPWLEAGGAYAVPNLRGGGEYGEEWHRDGMLDKKQNTFDDFIAAAEYLIEKGYTSPQKLAVAGGSNGGLLVGAVMTQRPELYGAVVCAVPLLDMVRYHKFGSGKTWMLEYGDPSKKEDFEYLYDYSPYHHVKEGTDYPALLMLAADSDDRVDPMHARKFTARVQYATSSHQPAIMRIEKNAGHGGGDMVKKYVDKYADQYAFLMKQLGVTSSGR
ncbi:S9 family peptidase [Persicimonas caeni]|uniref:prolyl oligopeptidase n=1 Tax=Persicimonas caeni TaxID=2292766 RepID=A0A4Y6PW25_PERCE|nr:prolyl oligopeptidase family serine peptidase [Persicimonas caeni]QDG52440.1 S9 family peptidase [Persicimonas caeni]QED33662.1 S9 family peptidase [Persicimonas caeni]